MSATATVPSPDKDLTDALGEEGAAEYRRLLRVLRSARGRFALFPIESDLLIPDRDAFLDRLGADLAQSSACLRRIDLTREQWDLFAHPDCPERFGKDDVVVVVGLEETPGIVPEPGKPPARPPAIALLNQLRETLRKRLGVPLLLWCPSHAYTALLKFAPDFFDHFIAQFHFPAPPQLKTTGRTDAGEPGTGAAVSGTRWESVSLSLPSSPTEMAFYEEEAAKWTDPTPERARALVGLADSVIRQTTGNRDANLRRAIALLEEALSIFTEEQLPREWAGTQINLGNAYLYLPSGERDANLRQAIACYEAALRVRTEEQFPREWAGTQINLGNAHCDLPSGERDANLRQAIAYYEAALRVCAEEQFPQDWAGIQNNLGATYRNLPSGERDANLRQAIACYEAALRVYTEEQFPYDWAATQNNLGNVYRDLPSGERDANLRQAIACYEAALRVRTEEQLPYQWAVTKENIGFTYLRQGALEAAREAFTEAVRGFLAVGDEERARQVEEWILEIDELDDQTECAAGDRETP